MDVLTLTGDGLGKVEVLVQFITSEPVNGLATVKSKRQDIAIPRGQSVIVSCRAAVGPPRYRYCLNLIQTILGKIAKNCNVIGSWMTS